MLFITVMNQVIIYYEF